MKTTIRLSVLLLSTLVLAGCSSCPCKKNVVQTPAPEVAAPMVASVVEETVPVTPAEPETNSIPAATRKYVNK